MKRVYRIEYKISTGINLNYTFFTRALVPSRSRTHIHNDFFYNSFAASFAILGVAAAAVVWSLSIFFCLQSFSVFCDFFVLVSARIIEFLNRLAQ